MTVNLNSLALSRVVSVNWTERLADFLSCTRLPYSLKMGDKNSSPQDGVKALMPSKSMIISSAFLSAFKVGKNAK